MRSFAMRAGVLACLLAGCASAPQPTPQPQPLAQPAPAPAPPPPPREAPPEAPPAVAAASIYFDYDSSTLSDDSRSKLQSFFGSVQNRSDLRIRIEGNCDERGTAEYNLALGPPHDHQQREGEASRDRPGRGRLAREPARRSAAGRIDDGSAVADGFARRRFQRPGPRFGVQRPDHDERSCSAYRSGGSVCASSPTSLGPNQES